MRKYQWHQTASASQLMTVEVTPLVQWARIYRAASAQINLDPLQLAALGTVQGSGFRVQGAGFRGQGAGFMDHGSGFRVQGAGFRVQGAGFRVQVSGFRFQGAGFRVQG